ncbi:MAG: PEP-utilizing enzyme [Patescibacteria group bacterium]
MYTKSKKSAKNDWHKSAAREMSFFSTNQIIKGYYNMHKIYKHTFKNALFYSQDGVMTLIRKKSEMNKLIDYYETLDEKYIIKELKKAEELYKQLKKQLPGLKLNTKTWSLLARLAEKVWLHYMFGIYFNYATERKKLDLIKEKNYKLVARVRNEINDLQILDDFLKKYYKKIDLTLLNSKEISKYLASKKLPNQNILLERKNEYLLAMTNLKTKTIKRQVIQKTLTKYLASENLANVSELKGIITYSKKVAGPAKIVLKKEQLSKIKSGDILITIMTNPEFIPSLKKVAGIVTDYGGLTCHASIISREMKIPCIVATKHATAIFKDGDLIEIDDKKSIVRKLKLA